MWSHLAFLNGKEWTQCVHGDRARVRHVAGKQAVVLCSSEALLEEPFLQEAGLTSADGYAAGGPGIGGRGPPVRGQCCPTHAVSGQGSNEVSVMGLARLFAGPVD